MSFVEIAIEIVVGSIITAPFLWIAGRMLVGGEKAKFTDAIMIGILGTVISAILNLYVGGYIGLIAQVIAQLYLVKRYFDTGWVKALAISIISGILAAIIGAVIIGLILGAGINLPV